MALSISGKGGAISGKGSAMGSGADKPVYGMLAEVRAYWEALRQGSALPRRDDLDPRGIAGALENTFLLERVAPGIARFRLAGMQLHDLMGMDVRGMPISAVIEPLARNRMAAALEAVFTGPGLLEVALEGERGIGRPALAARMILLPLVSVRGDVDLALGCLAFDGALGRAPRRFAIAGMTAQALVAGVSRALPTEAEVRAVAEAAGKGLAEAGVGFTARPLLPRAPRARSHLRLVSSRE